MGHLEEEDIVFVQRGKRKQQKSGGGEKSSEKAKGDEQVKTAANKNKEKLKTIKCFDCARWDALCPTAPK